MHIHDFASVTQGMVTTGNGAGARPGEWSLKIVESGDVEGDVLLADGLRSVQVEQNARTEKHLLKPYDLLVTARSQSVKVALVPPAVSRTVAASTLLVVRPLSRDSGVTHYLWYFLTSRRGRAAAGAMVAQGSTIPSLSASALGMIEIPMPNAHDLNILANLIEASEASYTASIEAARFRRETLRDAIIGAISAAPWKED